MIMESHNTYSSSSSESGSVVSGNNGNVVIGAAGSSERVVGGSNGARFPFILYQMLEDAEILGFDDTVSWCHHYGGITTVVRSGFKVHNRKSFEEDIMGRYFQNQTKYKSFLRQLNLYGFDRVSKGTNRGCMFHSMFVRGEPALCHNIKRPKIPTKKSQGQLQEASMKKMMKMQMNQGSRRGGVPQEYNMSTAANDLVSIFDELKGKSFDEISLHHNNASTSSSSSLSRKNIIELKSSEDWGSSSSSFSSFSSSSSAAAAAAAAAQENNNDDDSSSEPTTKLLKSMLEPTPRSSITTINDIDDDIANEIITTFCCPPV